MLPDHCPKMALISFYSQNMVGQDVLSNKVVVFMVFIFFFHLGAIFFLFIKKYQFEYSLENTRGEKKISINCLEIGQDNYCNLKKSDWN